MGNDPHIPHLKPVRNYSFAMQSMEEAVAAADCVLIATDHSDYDYDFIRAHAKLIVDTRNVFGNKAALSDKIFLA